MYFHEFINLHISQCETGEEGRGCSASSTSSQDIFITGQTKSYCSSESLAVGRQWDGD